MKKLAASIIIGIILLAGLCSPSLCKEQPLYIVTNDDSSETVGLFENYRTSKLRQVLSPADAQKNSKIYQKNPQKEESSLFFVNLDKDVSGFEPFKAMFGADFSKLGPKDIIVISKPKGGKNVNSALLIGYHDMEGFRIATRIFKKKGNESDYSFAQSIVDCNVYNEFDPSSVDYEGMELFCPIRNFAKGEEEAFIGKHGEANSIFVLNSLNIESISPGLRELLKDDIEKIKTNTFFLLIKRANDRFDLIMAAPSKQILAKNTIGSIFESLPTEPRIVEYPDLRNFAYVYIDTPQDSTNARSDVAEKLAPILQSSILRAGAFEIVDSAEKADMVITANITNISGYTVYENNKNRLTEVPHFYETEPPVPVKTSKMSDSDYEMQVEANRMQRKQYRAKKAIYDYAIDYGTYKWNIKVVEKSNVSLAGTIKAVDRLSGEVFFERAFQGKNDNEKTVMNQDYDVTGANNTPPDAPAYQNNNEISESLIPWAASTALNDWLERFKESVILPTEESRNARKAALQKLKSENKKSKKETAAPAQDCKMYDLDNNKTIGDGDLAVVKKSLKAKKGSAKYNKKADFDKNGTVNEEDIKQMKKCWKVSIQ